MASIEDKKTWKLADGAGHYALLTLLLGSSVYTVQPTDASYTPITLNEINDEYLLLYFEAKRIIAEELQQGVATITELEQWIGYIQTTTQMDFIHSGGTWNVLPSGDTEQVFNAIQADLLTYLNGLTNE